MLTLFLHLITLTFSAAAEVPAPPSGLDYRLDANVTYFNSDSNFTSGGGSTKALLNDGYFTDIIGRVQYTQDLDKAQRVYGGFTYSQTESYDGTATRTNNGFNELMAGGQWWFNFGPYRLVAAGDVVYPLYQVNKNGDDALLGEGAMKIRTGGWFIYPIKTLTPFAYLAYEYRDGGRSHAIPYAIGLNYRLSKIWLQGEYRGYEKLFDAADTENSTTRDAFLQKVDGGSYRYYALNSAMSELAASAGITFGTVTAYGEAAYMVNGSNVADGMTFMLGVAYVPGGRIHEAGSEDDDGSSRSRRRNMEPIEEPLPSTTGSEDDGFMSEPDPRIPPPPPPPVAPADRPDPTTAAPAAPSNSSDSDGGNVQLQMRPAGKPKLPPSQNAAQPRSKPTARPTTKPAPKVKTKKDKIDKMLKNTEKTLQNL